MKGGGAMVLFLICLVALAAFTVALVKVGGELP